MGSVRPAISSIPFFSQVATFEELWPLIPQHTHDVINHGKYSPGRMVAELERAGSLQRGDEVIVPAGRHPVFADISPQPLVVCHTSGTGVPEVVVHSARTLIHRLAGFEADRWPVPASRRNDTVASATSFVHGRAVHPPAARAFLAASRRRRPLDCIILGVPGRPPLAAPVVLTWNELPQTGTGKVRCRALRERLVGDAGTFGAGRWS